MQADELLASISCDENSAYCVGYSKPVDPLNVYRNASFINTNAHGGVSRRPLPYMMDDAPVMRSYTTEETAPPLRVMENTLPTKAAKPEAPSAKAPKAPKALEPALPRT